MDAAGLGKRLKGVLVSDDAQVDGGVAVLLDGGQQGGAVGVADLPWMEVVLWVQQLGWAHTGTHTHPYLSP